jgi:hypothetical protein
LRTLGGAQASGSIKNGEYSVTMSNGGSNTWDVSLNQTNLLIENGKTYKVFFDAYADASRKIWPLVGKNSEPFSVYSGNQSVVINTTKKTYSFSFTMTYPTDNEARLAFDIGTSSVDVYFDNIILEKINATEVESEKSAQPEDFVLFQNYPNPFNPSTKICYKLPVQSFVQIRIYDLLGKEIATLVDGNRAPGEHFVEWNAENLPSSIYIYRLTTGEFSETKKLILQK